MTLIWGRWYRTGYGIVIKKEHRELFEAYNLEIIPMGSRFFFVGAVAKVRYFVPQIEENSVNPFLQDQRSLLFAGFEQEGKIVKDLVDELDWRSDAVEKYNQSALRRDYVGRVIHIRSSDYEKIDLI